MGSFKKIDYFGSLIYKDSFTYDDLYIKDSFDLSLGATYNFTKDFSVSLKGKKPLKKIDPINLSREFFITSYSYSKRTRKSCGSIF